jgi:hypothetical protein
VLSHAAIGAMPRPGFPTCIRLSVLSSKMSDVCPVGAVPCRYGFYPVVRSWLSVRADHRRYPVPPSVLCPALLCRSASRLSGLSAAMSGVYPVGAWDAPNRLGRD